MSLGSWPSPSPGALPGPRQRGQPPLPYSLRKEEGAGSSLLALGLLSVKQEQPQRLGLLCAIRTQWHKIQSALPCQGPALSLLLSLAWGEGQLQGSRAQLLLPGLVPLCPSIDYGQEKGVLSPVGWGQESLGGGERLEEMEPGPAGKGPGSTEGGQGMPLADSDHTPFLLWHRSKPSP